MDFTPTYGAVLARNIRAARSRLDINQESLAARMRALGYSAWLRQTVSDTERRRRRITVEEVFGLAWALETSIGSLMRPAGEDLAVTLPSGALIGATSVSEMVGRGVNNGAVKWAGDSPFVTGSPAA